MKNSLKFFVLLLACPITALNSAQTSPLQPLTAALPPHQGTKSVTAEWLVSMPKIDVSPVKWLDDTHIVYSIASDKQGEIIKVLDLESLTHINLGEGTNSQPSPDGLWIAYFHEGQLWLMRNDGTEKKQLTSLPKRLAGSYNFHYGLAWAPNSTSIALYYQSSIYPVSPWQDKEDETVVDKSKTSAIDADSQDSHLSQAVIDLIDIKTAEIRQIANLKGNLRRLSWLPQGDELLFMREHFNFFGKVQTWVQSLRVSDGNSQTLATFDGMQQALDPASSPDGKQIAIAYDADNPEFDYMPSVGLILPNSHIQRLTYELKLFRPQWSNDGRKIYVIRNHGAYNQIYKIDIPTGETIQLTSAPLRINDYALSSDGTKLVWKGKDAQDNTIIRLAASDGKDVQDLVIIPSAPQDMALSEVREIEWEVPNYPVPMSGLLFLPINYREDVRYPLIVDIHGGGPGASIHLGGGVLGRNSLEWHMWTALGYAVFVPEFRSSASFGSLAITRDENQEYDLINKDINDIVAGVDFLIAKGIVDAKRTAVIGCSAGGRRANWLTVATHRFSAVVSLEGWADDWLIGGIYPSFQKHPVLAPEIYQKNSSLFHALNATTPTLFLMGNPKLGGIDPNDTVRWLYNALKAQGIKTKYVQYPDEGHAIERPENCLDALQRVQEWIAEYLKDSPIKEEQR
jgi:dipeptidyl aminopeptidase/acylaminoacyl peptidase